MITKINGVVISSGFGATERFRNGAAHTGIDIPLEANTVLQVIQDGVVTKVFDGSTAIGKGVAIKTKEGLTQIYGHLNQTSVAVGDQLHAGDVIGLSGNTGNVVGANGGYHLHFSTQTPDGSFVDPTRYADQLVAGHAGGGNWLMEKWNAAGDWVIGKETEFLFKPLQQALHDGIVSFWHWFIINLPDIMGYGAVLTGVLMILSAMAGKGMIKPAGFFGGALIVAVSILGGVK